MAAGQDGNNLTQQSYSYTMPSVTNGLLFVSISMQGGSVALSSASYAGQTMSIYGPNTLTYNGNAILYAFSLTNPASGPNTLQINFSSPSNNNQWTVQAYAFSGVNSATAIGTRATNGPQTGSPFGDSITTLQANSMLLDLLENTQNNFPSSEGSGQSYVGFDSSTSGVNSWAAYKAVVGSGAQSLSYSWAPSGQDLSSWTFEIEGVPVICGSPTPSPTLSPSPSITATPTLTPTSNLSQTQTPTPNGTNTPGAACTTTPMAGATTSFTSYEAEAGSLGGGASIVALSTPPTTEYSSPALEASGHAYIALNGNGQSVQWTNNTGQAINGINLRSSIPDAPGGGGISSTIDLYVGGSFRQAFNVNSTQNYCYEGTNYNNQTDKNPADGDPRFFWNDTRALVTGTPIQPGQTFSFQMDTANNNASFYDIDVVDIENVPLPLTMPANAIDISAAPYNAIPNNTSIDNTSAINSAFAAAQSSGQIVWIPEGVFSISAINGGLQGTGITIEGAGQWYSTFYRVTPNNNTQGIANIITCHSCTMQDMSLDCNANSRANNENNGAVNFDGNNWLVNRCWIQHVTSSFWCGGNTGMVENCRTLSTWADGGNFNNVQDSRGIGENLTYTNNFVRGTGDDAMAINSVNYNVNGSTTTYYTIMSNITYSNNTAVAPWGGKCMGIYGGNNSLVANNLCQDTARYLGLGVMRFGVNGSDLLSTTVTGNVLIRCGGDGYNQQQQAMMIGNGGDGQNSGTVENAFVGYNTINNSLYDAVGYSASINVVMQNNTINNPGLNGIAFGSQTLDLGSVAGCAILLNNTVTGLNAGYSAELNQPGTTYTVYTPTYASTYNSASAGIQTQSCSEGGSNVDFITSGSYTEYNSVNLTGMQEFVARVASAGTGGTIQIYLDSMTGSPVSTVSVPGTGCWQGWQDVQSGLSSVSGTHNVYLVYSGGSGDLFNLEWFAFTNQANVTN